MVNDGVIEENTSGGTLQINGTWTNQGTISATDATLDLYGAWTNYGTITADPSTVSLGSPTYGLGPTDPSAPNDYWSNGAGGTISIADGSTIFFGGVFTTDQFDALASMPGNSVNYASDYLYLDGSLDNSVADNPVSGGVLNLDASTGPLDLARRLLSTRVP